LGTGRLRPPRLIRTLNMENPVQIKRKCILIIIFNNDGADS